MSKLPDWRDAVGPGWASLLRRTHEELEAFDPSYSIAQVKEKFGELRVYCDHGGLDPGRILGKAAVESRSICEWCGKPGKTIKASGYWVKALCPEHITAWREGKRWWP